MRYKTVACILLILNLVIVAPVAVREVREATADAVDRGEDVKIVSGKRPLVRLQGPVEWEVESKFGRGVKR